MADAITIGILQAVGYLVLWGVGGASIAAIVLGIIHTRNEPEHAKAYWRREAHKKFVASLRKT